MTCVLAIDLGASSGKAFTARLSGGQLALQQVHRFDNRPVRVGDRQIWDAAHLSDEIDAAIRCGFETGHRPASVGIDGWAVDYALVDDRGALIEPIYSYRDPRAALAVAQVHERVSPRQLFARTGVQHLPFNTIFQLAARLADPGDRQALARARRLVMLPEYFAGRLAGRFVAEQTNASTTGLMGIETGRWDTPLCELVGLAPCLLPEIVPSGTCLARDVRLGPGSIHVFVPACHDTASAVVATPLRDRVTEGDSAFISAGTWSLVGAELPAPMVSEVAMRANFTNEAGVDGHTRFLKNIMGLWILQECRRAWREDGTGEFSFAELERLAGSVAGRVPRLDVDDVSFMAPPHMPRAIDAFCQKTGQPPPRDVGTTVRSILSSLAMRHAEVIRELERIIERPIRRIHLVGGGSRSPLLCQLTANATARVVESGPEAAAAIGNAVVQLMALGEIAGLKDARAIVTRSFHPNTYLPTGRN